MFVPALADLPKDASLTGAPTRVYLQLLQELDPIEYRAVKNWALAKGLGMKPQTIGRAIALLVERGYLVAGEWTRSTGRTYRVIYTRRSGAMTPQRHHSPRVAG